MSDAATDFSRALAVTLRFEGGNVDDPADHGGRTSRGITQKTYDGFCKAEGWATGDVFLATDAQVSLIYLKRFWNRAGCSSLPWPLNLAVFDTAVLHGTEFAVTRLQSVVGARPDGVFGPQTLGRVRAFNPYGVVEALLQRRDDRYEALITRDVTQRKFYGGWEQRCDELCDACGVPRTVDRAA